MRVAYSSNNSGGSWWLTDQDWRDLEAAGWAVQWFANDPDYRVDDEGRWLSALAHTATREGLKLMEAVEEWELVTGEKATDAGCACCGQPHYFTEYDDDGKYVQSGPDVEYRASW